MCLSLVALQKACGAEGTIGGLEKIYMISYGDLAPASGTAGTPIYTVATGGVVNDIGLASGKKFVEVGLLKSTSGLKEDLEKNTQNGTAFFKQEFTVVLSDMSAENHAFISSVLNQPVALLMKSRTGKYFVTGLNKSFELSAMTGGTGTAEGDLIGYSLTFSGFDNKLTPLVDGALIPDLI